MLRLLVGVADYGSLSASARAAGLAQSNSSRLVKVFERRLGYKLLHRSTRGSHLTQQGKLIAEWAREALEAIDRLAAGAEALSYSDTDMLTIGASMTIAEYLLPGWIKAFRTVHPDTTTTLRIMNSSHVIEAVAAGTVVLGFVETPEIPPELNSTLIWTDELVTVVSPAHPWASAKDPLTKKELSVSPLIEREEGSGTRAFLDLLVGAHRPSPLLELNSNSAICQAVIEGIGPAVLSRLAVANEIHNHRLAEVSLQGGPLIRPFRAVWKDSTHKVKLTNEFINISQNGA